MARSIASEALLLSVIDVGLRGLSGRRGLLVRAVRWRSRRMLDGAVDSERPLNKIDSELMRAAGLGLAVLLNNVQQARRATQAVEMVVHSRVGAEEVLLHDIEQVVERANRVAQGFSAGGSEWCGSARTAWSEVSRFGEHSDAPAQVDGRLRSRFVLSGSSTRRSRS